MRDENIRRLNQAAVRCSITLAVMFTVSARTCTVCGRKAHLAAGGDGASGEAIQGVLKAAKHCLFCGGRWSGVA